MTDKPTPTPTDAELKALWQIHAADIGGIFHYARAVLAKWGASHGQAPAKPDPAYSAACNLATALFKKHFAHLPDFASGQAVWSLCDSTAGVISQIDNMVAGLVQPPTQTQPVAREPLTANQVSGLAESAGYWHGDMSRADFINGIRCAEVAHGIKGENHDR